MTTNILHLNSSGRAKDSVTRAVGAQVVDYLQTSLASTRVTERDLSIGVPFINDNWIGANFTPANERLAAQNEFLATSNQLVEQINLADIVVIGSPIYNFSVPAVLKAWIDQIARAQLTFKYTENGPIGLMTGKKAILVMASGGVPIGSAMDFATPYLQQIMRFIGIEDITVIDGNEVSNDNSKSVEQQLAGFGSTSKSALISGA